MSVISYMTMMSKLKPRSEAINSALRIMYSSNGGYLNMQDIILLIACRHLLTVASGR